MDEVLLFHVTDCPISKKIKSYLDAHDILYDSVIVHHDEMHPSRIDLAQKAGTTKLPVINLANQYVAEHDSIIEYLEALKEE